LNDGLLDGMYVCISIISYKIFIPVDRHCLYKVLGLIVT